MHVVFSLSLSKPITGQEIANAVQAVAGKSYESEILQVIDGVKAFRIGRSSGFSSEDVCICTDEHGAAAIHLDKSYDKLYVCSSSWAGMKFAVLETESRVISAVEKFRDELQQELDRRSQE